MCVVANCALFSSSSQPSTVRNTAALLRSKDRRMLPIDQQGSKTYTVRKPRLPCGSMAPNHKVRIYKEYHSICPLVRIGTLPTPLSPASVPLPKNRGEGARTPAGEGLRESQFRRLEKSLALCLLCAPNVQNIEQPGLIPELSSRPRISSQKMQQNI